MNDFFALPLTDRLIMITYPLVLLTAVVLVLLYFLRRRKIKAGIVEISPDTQPSDAAGDDVPQASIVDDPRIILLYEMVHQHLRKIFDLTSPAAVLSAQLIAATNEINIYTTAALAELSGREDFDDIMRDVDLFRYRLLDFLVLIFRENHLAEMDDAQFLSHLRIRSQTATSMATLHMMKLPRVHPFMAARSTTDVMTMIVQVIIAGRDIAIARHKHAAEAEETHDRKIKAILRGDYKSVIQKVC